MSSAEGTWGWMRRTGLALLVLLTATTGLVGCKGAEERREMPRPVLVRKRDRAHWRDMLKREHQAWALLQADCRVTIYNPRLLTEKHFVRLKGGRLVVDKAGRLYVRIPDAQNHQLLLMGNGESFRADLPVVRESYSGFYDAPLDSNDANIKIMPADVVHAFCPTLLLQGRWLVLNAGAQMSTLTLVDLLKDPDTGGLAEVKIGAAITVDRRTELISKVNKFDDDGGIRVDVSYRRWAPVVVAADGREVRVPTSVVIEYPTDQTRVMFELSNVVLDEPLEGDVQFGDEP